MIPEIILRLLGSSTRGSGFGFPGSLTLFLSYNLGFICLFHNSRGSRANHDLSVLYALDDQGSSFLGSWMIGDHCA